MRETVFRLPFAFPIGQATRRRHSRAGGNLLRTAAHGGAQTAVPKPQQDSRLRGNDERNSGRGRRNCESSGKTAFQAALLPISRLRRFSLR